MENTNNPEETYYRSFPNLSKELREDRDENKLLTREITMINKEIEQVKWYKQQLETSTDSKGATDVRNNKKH